MAGYFRGTNLMASAGFRNCFRLVVLLFLSAVGDYGVAAFQLSMVASGTASGRMRSGSGSAGLSSSRAPFAVPPIPGAVGVSSGLISQMAEVAIKYRLKDQTEVACDVTARTSEMLKGRAGPIIVRGRGWESPLGLTCRAIEASVDECELDMARIITQQKIRLTNPATGKAMLAMNDDDFGNFITHPLIKPPGLSDGSILQLIKDDVQIDAQTGTVTFYGLNEGAKWKFVLSRGKHGAQVTAASLATIDNQKEMTEEMTDIATHFFNKMVFELDGTFMSYRDMMVTAKGKSPSLLLSLNLLVKKFPSRGAAF